MKYKYLLMVSVMAVIGAICFSACGSNNKTTSTKEPTQTFSTEAADAVTETPEATELISNSPMSEKDTSVINGFGNNEHGYSILSFDLKQGTCVDEGDCYVIEADFLKPVIVPSGLAVGDEFTFAHNELTNETETIKLVNEHSFQGADGFEYYILSGTENDNYLYCGSQDRVDSLFHTGKLYIRKTAITGVAITNGPYTTITAEELNEESMWFNGIKFDNEGYVVELIHFGD